MLFRRAPKLILRTERLVLRAPVMADHADWCTLRRGSVEFLKPWEPTWARDHFSRSAFRARVTWAAHSIARGRAVPLFIFRASDAALVGAITLDHIRRGPNQSGTVGYWIGQPYARMGFMQEALIKLRDYAFSTLDISRIEAGCLPANVASRGVLEKSGFKYEGVAQAYLQINGRWRNHVLYAALRLDRRGRSDAS